MSQQTTPPNFGPIKQLGYLVENIDQAVAAWMDHQGVGPWMIIKNVPLKCTYRGEPSSPLVDIALAYRGDVQIELIQQTNDAPSPYRYYFNNQQFGLHHTAYLCEEIDTDISNAVANGHEIVCDINMPDGSRYVYTQIPALGEHVFVEFLEATDIMKQMFRDGIEAAKQWQGDRNTTVIDYANFS